MGVGSGVTAIDVGDAIGSTVGVALSPHATVPINITRIDNTMIHDLRVKILNFIAFFLPLRDYSSV